MDILRSVCIVAPFVILALALWVRFKYVKNDALHAWCYGTAIGLAAFAAYKVGLFFGRASLEWWLGCILGIAWGAVAFFYFVLSAIDSVKAIEEGFDT